MGSSNSARPKSGGAVVAAASTSSKMHNNVTNNTPSSLATNFSSEANVIHQPLTQRDSTKLLEVRLLVITVLDI